MWSVSLVRWWRGNNVLWSSARWHFVFSSTSCTPSSYVKISLSSCYVTRISLYFMLRYVAFSCTSYTTSSYVKISLNWCYVTRTYLYFMLQNVAFSCASYTTSSYVKISLSWCYVTRNSSYFMLCYVAFSCTSYTVSSYVKISLPTWKVGKETQPWLKSTWCKVNDFRNAFLLVQESIFIFPRNGIATLRAWNPVIYIWRTCAQRITQRKNHQVLQGSSKRLLGRLPKQPKTSGALQRAWPCFSLFAVVHSKAFLFDVLLNPMVLNPSVLDSLSLGEY